MINDAYGLLAVLVLVPASLFYLAENTFMKAFFQRVPVLVFAYLVPSLLVMAGVIPADAPIYGDIMRFVLPASLLLLTLSIDLKGIYRLGPKALIMFFSATAGIIIGGPIALMIFGDYLPDDIWKGFAALAGSWTGGGVNFVAVGVSVGASETLLGMMVIVDVVVAYTWTALLMFFASKYKHIDRMHGADNHMVEELRERVETFQKSTARISTTSDFMVLIGVAFAAAWLARQLGLWLPPIGGIFDSFAWMIVIVTAFGVILSFTPFRQYEGAGASKLGTLMLYMLIGVIGVKADFTKIAEYPMLIAAGATWLLVHIIVLYIVMRFTRAPLFFMAVGSQANVGGVASAPIVASAFHPALATVGVLLGVAGYVVGTYAGLLTAYLMQLIAG